MNSSKFIIPCQSRVAYQPSSERSFQVTKSMEGKGRGAPVTALHLFLFSWNTKYLIPGQSACD